MRLTTALSLVLVLLSSPAAAAAMKGKVAAGINYPGLSLRYYPSDNYSLELRAQASDGVFAAGFRCSRYLRTTAAALPFWGLEADFLSFKGASSEGGGVALGALAGLEYFVARKVSVQLDGGPYLVSISDRRTGLSSGGLVFAANLGFNYYFGGGTAR